MTKPCKSPKFVLYTDGEFYSPFFNEGLGKMDPMYWENENRKIYSLEKIWNGKEMIFVPTFEISTAPILSGGNELTEQILSLLQKRGKDLLQKRISDLSSELIEKGCTQIFSFQTKIRYVRSNEDDGFVGLAAYMYIGVVGA